jgi:hypothetical protein
MCDNQQKHQLRQYSRERWPEDMMAMALHESSINDSIRLVLLVRLHLVLLLKLQRLFICWMLGMQALSCSQICMIPIMIHQPQHQYPSGSSLVHHSLSYMSAGYNLWTLTLM